MNMYRLKITDKTGKERESSRLYLDFFDHKRRRHKLAGFTSKRATEAMAKRINDLVSCRASGDSLTPDLQSWIDNLPDKLLRKFVSWGLLDTQRAHTGKPITEHLQAWKQHIIAGGKTAKHADTQHNRVSSIFDQCGFIVFNNISASKLQQEISKLNKTIKVRNKKTKKLEDKIIGEASKATKNYYLKACQQFCRWMVKDGRATQNPLEHLSPNKIKKGDEEHPRRVLELDELRHLLEVTKKAELRYGMSGHERYLLYKITAETGLRANEIRSLKVNSFDFNSLTVTVSGDHTKNGREAIQQLRPDTARELKEFFTGKLPTVKAFGGTYKQLTDKTADALKADLAEAKIPYVVDGLYFDYHSLRHQTASLLASANIHPKVAQSIMRHGDINLTMSRYTHTLTGQEKKAVAELPDLSLPSRESQKQKATGTDDKTVDNFLTPIWTQSCTEDGFSRTNLDARGGDMGNEKSPVLAPKTGISGQKQGSSSNEAEGTRTLNLRIDSPML